MKNNKKNWSKIKKTVIDNASKVVLKRKALYGIADTREMLRKIQDEVIDCIITSPPYGNLKDYGSNNQIGFGQNTVDEYLPDITIILAELYRILKNNGSMWIVIDNLKIFGKTIPLPWEIINRANEIGWTFHDIVVWDKGRSLPWSHRGRFRSVCEFILLFGKNSLKVFNLDAVRDAEHLSSYWVKYPERFHPDGKAPSNLWHIPTPIQGSWAQGKGPIRHFCPFPIELVARMINISTKNNDIILDPFSGTGSVLTTASYLGRYGVGFDVNNRFANEFDQKGFKSNMEHAKEIMPKEKMDNNQLRKIIIKLRMLKYPKTLFSQLTRVDRLNGNAREHISLFIVKALNFKNLDSKYINTIELGHISIDVLVKKGTNLRKLNKMISNLAAKPPLSKFGLKVDIRIVSARKWNDTSYTESICLSYLYKKGIFYKFSKKIMKKDITHIIRDEAKSNYKVPSILSNIRVDSYLPMQD